MALQAVEQVLSRALLLAATLFLACCWRRGYWIGSQPLFEQAQRTRFIRKLLVCWEQDLPLRLGSCYGILDFYVPAQAEKSAEGVLNRPHPARQASWQLALQNDRRAVGQSATSPSLNSSAPMGRGVRVPYRADEVIIGRSG